MFVSTFPSLPNGYMRKKENVSVLWKKCRISLRNGLRRIAYLSIFQTTQADQMRITLVLLGLSLRDKLCLFLHSLLYLMDRRQKERTFPFYEKSQISLRNGLRKIPFLTNFRITQEDQMRITLVLLGLSLWDKLCLFLHFLLYLMDIREKERA